MAMASALIQFAQGEHTDAAGKAVLGAFGNFSAVTVTNGNNTGVTSWKIYLLDAPPDSAAYPVGSQPRILAEATSNTPTVAFTPDAAGTYRVMLETSDGSSVDRDIRCFAIPDGRGFVRPPFQSPDPLPADLPTIIKLDPRPNKPDEQNYGSNVRGWAGNGSAGQLDAFLRRYDDLPQRAVTSTPFTAAETDPPLFVVNVAGEPVFNLPDGPRAGFVTRVICEGDPVTVAPLGDGDINGLPHDLLRAGDAATYVHRGSNLWHVLARELSPARRLPVGTLPNQFPLWNNTDRVWETSAGAPFYGGVSVMDYLTDSNTIVDAINEALADTSPEAWQVFFPPGAYTIDGFIVSAVASKSIVFIPGAVLQITPQAGNIFTISGANSKLSGLNVCIQLATDTSFTAVKVLGDGSRIDGARFEVIGQEIPNGTLLRIAADRVHLHSMTVRSDGCSIYRPLHLERDTAGSDGTECSCCAVYGMHADLGTPSVDKSYDALVFWKAYASELHQFSFVGGGRSLFPNGIIVISGHRNVLYNPRIFSYGAKYGIRSLPVTSEFLQIIGGDIRGRNNGTYVEDSEGISCGHYNGHLKLFGTAVAGWDFGVGIHGSHDTPQFYGAVLANNNRYGLLIDANGWGVRGITFTSCYIGDVLQRGFIWFKTGQTQGVSITGCEIGYGDVAIEVGSEYGALHGVVLMGNYIQGGLNDITPLGVVRWAADNSNVLFVNNHHGGPGTLGVGPYAHRAMDIFSPTFAAAKATTSLTVGATGNPWLQRFFTYNTANFGAGIPANGAVELDYSWPDGAVTTYMLTFGLTGTLAAHTDLSFHAYVKATGTITLRARNHSASPIGPISGTVFFESTKNF